MLHLPQSHRSTSSSPWCHALLFTERHDRKSSSDFTHGFDSRRGRELRKTAAILRQESQPRRVWPWKRWSAAWRRFCSRREWAGLALDIVWEALALLTDTTVTYWLLKVELLRFLRAVPFTHLLYLESVCRDVSSFFSCNFLCRFF